MTTKKTTQDLLSASARVLALAEQRKQRMAKSAPAKKAVAAAKPAAKKVAANPEAAPVAAPAAPAPAAVAAPVVEAPKVETAPVVEQPKVEEPAATQAAPAVAAKADVKAADQTGSGSLEQVGDPGKAADLGEPEGGWGAAVPPELAKAIEDGKVEEDDSLTPGIIIPPDLADSVMAVADPATLSEDGVIAFDLIPFLPTQATSAADVVAAGAHWILCANGEPLAKIALKDQDHAERIATHFASEEFARSIVDGIEKHGIQKTLAAVKAKPYVAIVDTQKKVSEIKAKLAASTEEALRQKVAGLKAKYVNTLDLVLEASANNFIVENPLKDVLIAQMESLGIPEATAADMVDAAFFQVGPKMVANLLDKAEEFANMPADALAHVKEAIQAAGRRSRPLPSALSPAQTNPNYDAGLAQRMQAAAIPVTPAVSADQPATLSASVRVTTPAPAQSSDKAAFRARFGGFRR